jgi:hypothetical protein
MTRSSHLRQTTGPAETPAVLDVGIDAEGHTGGFC